ncbi:TetR/AcrR family transcriptional regulator [Gordonia crocea]|uniref:TetR/AcrR family transcriptional regulator n=1 Tax=Gordonia crocea TaxID=589162 RepID=UPI00137AB285|nr:TetR/AcrR family transcriptional regulator [Gordonia crocea]
MRSRGKIIDATLELIAEDGFEGVTIAAAAHRAGVSRQTVHSIFGNRETMVSEAMAHLTRTTTDDLRAVIAQTEDPVEFVIELIAAGVGFARTTPAIAALVGVGGGNPLFDPGALDRAKPVTLEFLGPVADRFTEIDEVAAVATHLSLTLFLFGDADQTTDDLREFLRRWLSPALSQLVRG